MKRMEIKGIDFAYITLHAGLGNFKGGALVYKQPTLPEIQSYCRREVATLWPEVLRFDYPHNYYGDLSDELLEIKTSLLNARR